jgi:hypothetical protein
MFFHRACHALWHALLVFEPRLSECACKNMVKMNVIASQREQARVEIPSTTPSQHQDNDQQEGAGVADEQEGGGRTDVVPYIFRIA